MKIRSPNLFEARPPSLGVAIGCDPPSPPDVDCKRVGC
jgi:hypothetical protein